MNNVELSLAQCRQIDLVLDAAFTLIKTMIDPEKLDELEPDISMIGPLAEYAADILVSHGYRAYYPYMDEGCDAIHDFYEPQQDDEHKIIHMNSYILKEDDND